MSAVKFWTRKTDVNLPSNKKGLSCCGENNTAGEPQIAQFYGGLKFFMDFGGLINKAKSLKIYKIIDQIGKKLLPLTAHMKQIFRLQCMETPQL